MPQWLITMIENALVQVLTNLLASHGAAPKDPPTLT